MSEVKCNRESWCNRREGRWKQLAVALCETVGADHDPTRPNTCGIDTAAAAAAAAAAASRDRPKAVSQSAKVPLYRKLRNWKFAASCLGIPAREIRSKGVRLFLEARKIAQTVG